MPSPVSSGSTTEHVGPFQFAILMLSVLALAAIAIDTFVRLPHEVSRLLQAVDFVACGAFFLDFVVRFRAAESKTAFMRWGWIDLVSSVPNIEVLRLGRFVRVLRLLRLVRGITSLHRLLGMVFSNRRQGGVIVVAMTMFVLVVCSSVGVLFCETSNGSNIRTAEDAVWWSVTTVTTVGYGDRYPVTIVGRVIAMCLMISGVGLFGALSGIIASLFLGRSEQETALAAEVKGLRAEVERLRANAEPRP